MRPLRWWAESAPPGWDRVKVSENLGATAVAPVAPAHGLRTPNEGINQRNLKFLADVADKICFGRTYKFGIGI